MSFKALQVIIWCIFGPYPTLINAINTTQEHSFGGRQKSIRHVYYLSSGTLLNLSLPSRVARMARRPLGAVLDSVVGALVVVAALTWADIVSLPSFPCLSLLPFFHVPSVLLPMRRWISTARSWSKFQPILGGSSILFSNNPY
jgi:hypothetical protein